MSNFETVQRRARDAEIKIARGESALDTDNFGDGLFPLPGEGRTGIISKEKRVINTFLLLLAAAVGSGLALHLLSQPAEASQLGITSDIPKALSCDFQVSPAPDHRSSQISGSVPLAELLARGTKTFDVLSARKWTFCAPGANGAVYVTRIQNDEGAVVAQRGNTIHIERLSISELLPEYKGTPPKRTEDMIWGMGPCDATIEGSNARINCTLPRPW